MRKWLNQLRERIFGQPDKVAPLPPLPPPDPEPDEIAVPEISAATLQAWVTQAAPPCLLDVREPYEWRQVHLPDALHIPMNDLPQRLDELPRTVPIVVFCAHGMRSYDVAAYLVEQGYQASSLAGGITAWVSAGGEYSQEVPPNAAH